MRQQTDRHLVAVPTPVANDGKGATITLKAPGKQVSKEHPFEGPLPKAMDHLMAVRHLMIHQRMSLAEADEAVLKARVSHDGKGRKFQPSHLR
ncbi:MAG TPA: hypothetical protein VEV45_20765 [Streptosporangiaceae bacterium]|nr:hypothetical protein [Streptosporangiaceae bacterium]